MKRAFFISLSVTALFLLLSFVNKEKIDKPTASYNVVDDFPPAHAPSIELSDLLERLEHAKSDEERVKIVNEESSKGLLTPHITACVRSEGYECYIDDFTFGYGAGVAGNVTYADGWIETGIFRNELFVRITGGDCFGKGIVMFVACGNLTSYRLFKPEEEVVIAEVLDHPLFAVADKKNE